MLDKRVVVKILGTAQDAGVPQANCRCQNCSAARANGARRKYAASLAVVQPGSHHWYLFDATPDLPEQLELIFDEYPDLGLMQGIFLTHAHIGHYTGLMYLGKEVVAACGVPVWCGPGMTELLAHSAPWKQLVDLGNIGLHLLHDDQSVAPSPCLHVTPWLVPHRNEYAETYGFLLEGPERKLLYIPDIDRWESWERSLPEVAEMVDYCLLDATFYSRDELEIRGRDYDAIPHPLVTVTMDLLQAAADRGKYISFIHLNHTNPLLREDSSAYREVLRRGFHIARQGEELLL